MGHIVDKTGRPYTNAPTFEGASYAPRMSNFIAPTIGPNAAIGNNLSTLRGRSRQAIRNNPLAKGAQTTRTANMVGTGIKPRFNFDKNTELKERVQELWLDSVSEFDWDENTDFYGLQGIISNALFSDGESLAMFRPRNSYADLMVPLQIQLLEADHLDIAYTTTLPSGNKIRMGIEYNTMGKRVAYWLHKDHPGEAYMNSDMGRARVPAKNIMHIFDPTRPGQQRGLPSMSSTLVKLHEIDQCVDAELVRRKTTALFGGFITSPDEEGGIPDFMGVAESTSTGDVQGLEPGSFAVLSPGQEVTFSEPKDVSGSYNAWMRQQLMDLSRGWGITAEQLTGDLSEVNYSSIRAGLLEFRRMITMELKKTLVFQFCRPVIQRWMSTAVLANKLHIENFHIDKRKYYRGISWQTQPWAWVDPYKDMLAEILEIRGGLKNYTQALSDRGQDIETFFAERNEEEKILDAYKFIFDTDPRRTTSKGMYQAMGETEEGGKKKDE